MIKSQKTNLKSVIKRGINKPAIVRNIFKNNNPKKKTETVTSASLSNDMISTFTSSDLDNDDSSSSCFYKTEGYCLKCNDIITSAYTGIECEFCSHRYHLKCLSSSEYCDLGLKETVLFICNVCQKDLSQ